MTHTLRLRQNKNEVVWTCCENGRRKTGEESYESYNERKNACGETVSNGEILCWPHATITSREDKSSKSLKIQVTVAFSIITGINRVTYLIAGQ